LLNKGVRHRLTAAQGKLRGSQVLAYRARVREKHKGQFDNRRVLATLALARACPLMLIHLRFCRLQFAPQPFERGWQTYLRHLYHPQKLGLYMLPHPFRTTLFQNKWYIFVKQQIINN
jgi:hypothetical protein